jgi:hypothetical protein
MRADEVDSDTLAAHVCAGLRELQEFASSAQFQGLLDELYALPTPERAKFVIDVILNPPELEKRQIVVPPNIKLQRSAFRDDRPTLFCMVLYIPDGLQWSKVTITYDNPSGPPAILYSEVAHRFNREVAEETYQ